jgi:flavin reductase (DIM6/NTAB) family NADH-FMN oxidoreductase RutF
MNPDILEKGHQCSARYPKEISEFEATGLTEMWREDFKAPFVKESLIQMALELAQHIPLEINGTEIVIAEIKQLYAPPECLQEDGYLDIEKAQTICVSGLDSYHKTQRIDRLSYAKPDSWPSPLKS